MEKSLEILKVFLAQFIKKFISLYVKKWEDAYPDSVFSKSQKRNLTKLVDIGWEF
ncbi:MAG: hypothetical protein KAR38_02410 [Calditrichia bacterium]|nr:hypothetical protein [Calditrichia bacterium]